MEDPKKDLNAGASGPSGPDRPVKPKTDDTAEGATGASGASGATGASGPAGDNVSISKSELEQLKKDAGLKENYRKGIIRLTRKNGRFLPGSDSDQQPKHEEEEGDEEIDFGGDDKEKKPKKKEAAPKANLLTEKDAIDIACRDEEVENNWEDIVIYYEPKHGKSSVGAILKDIDAAVKMWKEKNKSTAAPAAPRQQIATDTSIEKGKEKKPIPPKKTIIPPKAKMTDWYPEKK